MSCIVIMFFLKKRLSFPVFGHCSANVHTKDGNIIAVTGGFNGVTMDYSNKARSK